MALPFQPESLDSLRARFPKALEKVWIAKPDMIERPGNLREHIFDFPEGMRIIISRDDFGKGSYIHVSASNSRMLPLIKMTKKVQQVYESLGGKGKLRFIHCTEKMVYHWVVDNG